MQLFVAPPPPEVAALYRVALILARGSALVVTYRRADV